MKKFKIDRRYIVIQTLKVIVGYLVGLLLVLLFFDKSSPMDFVVESSVAAIVIYFLFFFPRSILIKDRTLSFVETGSFERKLVNIADIKEIARTNKFYNTVMLITRDGSMYKLHPKKAEEFERILNYLK